MLDMVPVLVEVLGQIMVDKRPPVVVPMLAEVFREDNPQEKFALLLAISLLSSLMMWLPEISDLDVLAG